MASTITAADLTVSITEKLTLDGRNEGGTTTVVRSSSKQINDLYRRIVPVIATAETVLFTSHTSTRGVSIFDYNDVQYLRITNKDAANSIDLIIANGDDDEAGYRLKAGESLVLWGLEDILDAVTTASTVTVTNGTAATADLTIADGDEAASGQFTEGEYVKFIATDGTVGIFILSDSSETDAVSSGTVLNSTSDLGTGVPSASLLSQGVCVAVTMNLNTCTQALLLNELRDTMGAGTSPLINKVSGASGTVPSSNGNQTLTFTQTYLGTAGNTGTTTDISQLTAADFTGGLDGECTGKSYIKSINAIAEVADVDVEVFIASKVS